MAPNEPRDGKPGTTDQFPRWEGPEENRPAGYLPAEDSPVSGGKADPDIEKDYPLPAFIEKLRRLADALENGQRYQIDIAGERISVPVRAHYNIAHERGDGEEEIEFQIIWSDGERQPPD